MSGVLGGFALAFVVVVPAVAFVLAAFAGDDRWTVLFGWIFFAAIAFDVFIALWVAA